MREGARHIEGNVPGAGARLHSDGLTGLRAYAALWVMLHHVNAVVGPKPLVFTLPGLAIDLTPLATIGWVGVDLFFVLSGFLLTTHLLERWPGADRGELLGSYFRARVRRVVPAYWIQLAILLGVAVATGGGRLPEWSRDLPLHALMLHNVTEATSSSINGVYWTLPIEFAFYICLPLFAGYLARGERAGGRTAWLRLAAYVAFGVGLTWACRYAVFVAYSGSPVHTVFWATSQLPGTLDQFVIGSASAAGYRLLGGRAAFEAVRRAPVLSSALLAAGAGGLVAMMYYMHRIHELYWAGHWALFAWHTIAATCVAAVILAIVISGPATRLAFGNRPAVFLGTVSYSIYLWHLPVILWTARFADLPSLGLGAALFLVAAPVLAASTASYYLTERPFLRRPGGAAAGG